MCATCGAGVFIEVEFGDLIGNQQVAQSKSL